MVRIIFLYILTCTMYIHGASFDCMKARTHVEKMICADAEISQLDTRLGKVYSDVLANLSNEKTRVFKKNGRKWIKQRNKCVRSECLVNSYNSRIEHLNRLLHNLRKNKNNNIDSDLDALDNACILYNIEADRYSINSECIETMYITNVMNSLKDKTLTEIQTLRAGYYLYKLNPLGLDATRNIMVDSANDSRINRAIKMMQVLQDVMNNDTYNNEYSDDIFLLAKMARGILFDYTAIKGAPHERYIPSKAQKQKWYKAYISDIDFIDSMLEPIRGRKFSEIDNSQHDRKLKKDNNWVEDANTLVQTIYNNLTNQPPQCSNNTVINLVSTIYTDMYKKNSMHMLALEGVIVPQKITRLESIRAINYDDSIKLRKCVASAVLNTTGSVSVNIEYSVQTNEQNPQQFYVEVKPSVLKGAVQEIMKLRLGL